MIIKSIARSQFYAPNKLSKDTMIEKEEECCICSAKIITGKPVLRRRENNQILCLNCIMDIAELSE